MLFIQLRKKTVLNCCAEFLLHIDYVIFTPTFVINDVQTTTQVCSLKQLTYPNVLFGINATTQESKYIFTVIYEKAAIYF
mgnify:CR=1 FL=1